MTVEKFDACDREWDNIDFLRNSIETHKNDPAVHHFSISQLDYFQQNLSKDCTYDKFKSARARLAWLGHTRPDLFCIKNKSDQITPEIFSEKKIKNLKRQFPRFCLQNKQKCVIFHLVKLLFIYVRTYMHLSLEMITNPLNLAISLYFATKTIAVTFLNFQSSRFAML